MTNSLAEKIRDPGSCYGAPAEVLSDDTLNIHEKRKVLKTMELEAKLVSVAASEGMGEDENPDPFSLGAVRKARQALAGDGMDRDAADSSARRVGNANRFPYRRILVALDTEDPLVDEILSTAIEFSHEAQATIRFLTVVSKIPAVVDESSRMPVVDPAISLAHQDDLTKETVAKKKEAGRDLLKAFAPVGDSRHLVRRGVMEDEIVEYAREWPADLLIMGAHSRKWFEKLLIAPSSSRVIDRVNCAVLIVPEADAADR